MKPYKISAFLLEEQKSYFFTGAEYNMVFLKRFYNFFFQNVFFRYIIMEDSWMFVFASLVILSFVVVNMMAARLNPPGLPPPGLPPPVNAQNKRPYQFYPRATLGRANRHSES